MSKIVTDTIKLKRLLQIYLKTNLKKRLFHKSIIYLLEKEKGFGLSANQIGVDKRMCVINIKEPMVLVNPKIVKRSEDGFNILKVVYHYQKQ